MQDTPQAILFHAALSYLATATDQGDPRLSHAIGLRADQVTRLQCMSTRAVMKMATKSAGCIQVEVDPEVFDELARDVDQEIEEEQLIETFILHDASREMMTDLFGMSHRDYAQVRRFLNLEQTTGRTRQLTPDESEAVYMAWQERGDVREPADYLAVAQDLGLSLRVIWDDEFARNDLATKS